MGTEMKIKLATLIICIFSSAACFGGENDGAFGLSWGMTKSQVEKLGIKVEPKSAQGRIETFIATSLPKNISITESYLLSFDNKFNLQKVEMMSKDIDGDIYGNKGKETYANLKEALIKKYGAVTNGLEKVGLKLYGEADEFYQCLAYDGCGMWTAVFREQGIVLSLKGLGRGKGYIYLVYEGPKWEGVVDALKARQLKADESAL